MTTERTLRLHKPELDDLWFREKLLSDPDTMSYNNKWGGTIPFPQEKWNDWYQQWVAENDGRHFYRYLSDEDKFVGEAAYHYDESRDVYLCSLVVLSGERGKGYGKEGLKLLCEAAKENLVDVLFDDIAADNPSVKLFLDCGFKVVCQRADVVTVKKAL